jgi:DNA-binding transcriptional MerR regulator
LEKSPSIRTISEAAEELDVPQHVLRFMGSPVCPNQAMKRAGGRRYYRPADLDLLKGIRSLLYSEGYTIRGLQRILKEEGVAYVSGVGRGEIVARKRDMELDGVPPPDTNAPRFRGSAPLPEGPLAASREAPGEAPDICNSVAGGRPGGVARSVIT